jgi:hypothetical protein
MMSHLGLVKSICGTAYSGNLPLCRVPGIFNFCYTVKNKHPRHIVRCQRD